MALGAQGASRSAGASVDSAPGTLPAPKQPVEGRRGSEVEARPVGGAEGRHPRAAAAAAVTAVASAGARRGQGRTFGGCGGLRQPASAPHQSSIPEKQRISLGAPLAMPLPGLAPRRRPPLAASGSFFGVVGAGAPDPVRAAPPSGPPAMVLLVSQPPSVWLAGAQDCLASGHASALLGPRVSQSAWPSSFLESLNLTSAGSCTSSSGSPLPSLPGEMKAQPLGLASGISKPSHLPSSLVITVGPCPRALKLSRLKCFQ